MLAWMFGQEFTGGTITGLFALPIGRGRIALAKLTVLSIWATLVSITLTFSVLALGLLFGYGLPGGETWAALGRLCALGVLSAGIAIPVAWIATLTRSLLAAVVSTIALVVIAQVGALAGAGGWMPLAVPALWAMSDGTAVTRMQLSVTRLFALAFTVFTCMARKRLQLDR